MGRGEVEAFVPHDRDVRTEAFESGLRGVLGVREIGRNMNPPMRERCPYGFEPFPNACLARVYLLPSADQADHDGPGFVPVEVRDQEFRLGLVEVRDLLAPTHEVRGLRLRPSPLRFVEDDHMVVGGTRRPDTFISEVVDVLNERLDALLHCAFSFSVAEACQFVAGKGLLKDRHQWPVSREIHGSCFPERLPARRHVQADERFTCARHAGDKHDGLLAAVTGTIDDLLDANGGQAQVPGAGVVARDGATRN
jgi:hypothetical protein